MKISFWIPAVVLYMVRGAFSNSVQVGTVLFTTTDLVKKCWTESDKSLLKARLIMQDVLPDPDCIDFSNPEAVAILLDYFHACYRIISTSTYGKLQNLMYLALSDALGGYLRAYVLPFTRRAYYAGQVKYLEAKKLFQLYDDIRVFLKSNGVGWAEPQKLCYKKFHVRPLVITGGALEACKELYVIEKQGKIHCINPKLAQKSGKDAKEEKQGKEAKEGKPEIKGGFPESPEKFARAKPCISQCPRPHHSKTSKRGRRCAENNEQLSFYNYINSRSGGERFLKQWRGNTTGGPQEGAEGRRVRQNYEQRDEGTSEENLKRVIVPLPVLDDYQTPHSIAVPFIRQPFRNLKSACSAFVLEYYYLAVVKCFIAKGNSRTDIKNFNGQFYNWLVTQVLPHLSEEQWYPGFGGVLRVLQTIKKFGVETGSSDPVLNDVAFMFNQGTEFEMEDSLKEKGKNKVRDVAVEENDVDFPNPQRHVITAIIIVSMIWLFIFCAFAFYCQATRGRRLLYEGTKQQPGLGGDRRGDDNLNFQFLVKFFKRNNEFRNESRENLCLRIGKYRDTAFTPAVLEPYLPPEKNDFPGQNIPRRPGDGDCFSYFGSLLSSILPGQPFLPSFNEPQHQRLEDRPGGEARHPNKGQGDQIQMLWKKPSVLFEESIPSKEGRESRKRRYETTMSGTGSEDLRGRTTTNSCSACLEGEKRFRHRTASHHFKTTNSSSLLDDTKGYTSEKQTSTCYCSEGCPFAHTTTTSSTQLAGKLSSATMEFFEEVIAKHKPKKSSTQDSTAESESECSTSSETDY